MIPQHKIKVHYYRAEAGSDVGNAIDRYIAVAEGFLNKVDAIIAKHGADSASLLSDFDGMRISGLNFDYETAPLNWDMGPFGSFNPKWQDKDAADFEPRLSYFNEFYSKAIQGLRFAKIDGDLILAVSVRDNESAPEIEGAKPISECSFEDLKYRVNDDDLTRLDNLSDFYWTPQPLDLAPAFEVSEHVRQLNQERSRPGSDVGLQFKHSAFGMRLHRFVRSIIPGQADLAVAHTK